MVAKTAREREQEIRMVRELIESGRVASWAQLGHVLGISGSAANQRFGRGSVKRPGYGLVMPPRRRRYRQMVSVTLDDGLNARLEEMRKQWPGRIPSRAAVVRSILEERLTDAGR